MIEPEKWKQPEGIFERVFWKKAMRTFEDTLHSERETWLQKVKRGERVEHEFAENLQTLREFWGKFFNQYACLSESERKQWQIEARRFGPAAQDFAETLQKLFQRQVQIDKKPSPIERRQYVRASVGAKHTCRFQVGVRSFRDIQISNLSACGCVLKVPTYLAKEFNTGNCLSLFYLIQPHVPTIPLKGTVSWIGGVQSDKVYGFVLLGIQFVDLDPVFQKMLDAHVCKLLK
jgi:hypothetical protein